MDEFRFLLEETPILVINCTFAFLMHPPYIVRKQSNEAHILDSLLIKSSKMASNYKIGESPVINQSATKTALACVTFSVSLIVAKGIDD